MDHLVARKPVGQLHVDPAIKMDPEGFDYRHSEAWTISDYETIPLASKEIQHSKSDKFVPEQLKTGVGNKWDVDDHLLSNGYISDEEIFSPVDDDDNVFSSAGSDGERISLEDELSVLEDIPEAATIVQACSRAQAIQVVSAGKAKMVTMPKLFNVPPAKPLVGLGISRTESPLRSRLRRSNTDDTPSSGRSIFERTSNEQFPYFYEPAEIAEQTYEQPSLRRKPNLPLLNTSPSSLSVPRVPTLTSQTPLATQRAEFLKYDPYPAASKASPLSPSTSSTSRRKLQKLPSSLSLKGIGKGRLRSASSDSAADIQFDRVARLAPASETHLPSARPTTAGKTKLKMVPRGATERAPPLILPPCPDEYFEPAPRPTCPVARMPPPPMPKEDPTPSITTQMERTPTFSRRHARRKSLSATVVSVQA